MTDNPSLLRSDPALLPDDMLIDMQQWSVLEDRARETVRGWRRVGVMPPEDAMHGNSPRWRMSTYRAWKEARAT